MQKHKLTTEQEQKITKFLAETNKLGFLDWAGELKQKFQDAEIFLVGGAVRDVLLGKATKDYDFVVRNVTAGDLESFLTKRGWVELLGKNFGVFKFVPKNIKEKNPDIEPFDIALPRTEFSLDFDGGYKNFDVQSDESLPVIEDLKRRDFTINAFAIQILEDGEFGFIDQFDGLADLENKTIRAIGKPEDRFREDYSRILRAVRFACQLGFEIEPTTLVELKKLTQNLNQKKEGDYLVPREIVAREFLKSLRLAPVRSFDLMIETGIFNVLIPEVLEMENCEQPQNYHTEGNVLKHTRLCLEQLESDLYREEFSDIYTLENESNKKLWDAELVVSILLHDIEKPSTQIWVEKDGEQRMQFYNHDVDGAKTSEEICQRLKLSSPDKDGVKIKNISWLIARHIMLIPGKIDKMKATKIEKYFLSEDYPGEKLLKIVFVDATSTIQAGRQVPRTKEDLHDWIALRGYHIAKDRIAEIKKIKSKIKYKKSFLNGQDIMKTLKLRPGIEVGEILEQLREAELIGQVGNKKQALDFIKKIKIN
jgi:tRNA nucleotidyltransferase/poly(A) polymerase